MAAAPVRDLRARRHRGSALRAVLTLFLFWTSHQSAVRTRTSATASDARHRRQGLHTTALAAANVGLETVARGSQSPAREGPRLVDADGGFQPGQRGSTNIALYVLLCVMVVGGVQPIGRWRTDLPRRHAGRAGLSPGAGLRHTTAERPMFVPSARSAWPRATPAAARHGQRGVLGSIARGLLLSAIFWRRDDCRDSRLLRRHRLDRAGNGVVSFVGGKDSRGSCDTVPVCVLPCRGLVVCRRRLDYVNPYGRFVPYRKVVNVAKALVKPATPDPSSPPGPCPRAPSMLRKIDGYRAGALTPGATNLAQDHRPSHPQPRPDRRHPPRACRCQRTAATSRVHPNAGAPFRLAVSKVARAPSRLGWDSSSCPCRC